MASRAATTTGSIAANSPDAATSPLAAVAPAAGEVLTPQDPAAETVVFAAASSDAAANQLTLRLRQLALRISS